MEIKIKKLNPRAIIPTRGSEDAAGYDLYNTENVVILPGMSYKAHTDIALEIPVGYFGAIFARSGLSTKRGLRPANCVGVIDPDYRGEILVPLYNDSNCGQEIKAGERIAQLIILPYQSILFTEVDELSDSERDNGGFGSSGK